MQCLNRLLLISAVICIEVVSGALAQTTRPASERAELLGGSLDKNTTAHRIGDAFEKRPPLMRPSAAHALLFNAALGRLGLGGTGVGIDPSSTTGLIRLLGAAMNQSSSPNSIVDSIADVRHFGAKQGENAQSAVAAAVAAGYDKIFLPSGFYYQGGGKSGSHIFTLTPENTTIFCENSENSLIKAVNRTDSAVEGYIYLGSQSKLLGCASQSYPGDHDYGPHTVSQPFVYYNGDGRTTYVPWGGATAIILGAVSTTDGGPIRDNPGLQIVEKSTGDAFYAGVAGPGVGVRVVTDSDTTHDQGILILNGPSNSSVNHTGLHIVEHGTNPRGCSICMERANGSTAPLFRMTDDGPGTASTDWYQETIAHQTSGFIHDIYQSRTSFGGSFFHVNAGNSGGSFTGLFEDFLIAGKSVFSVDHAGKTTAEHLRIPSLKGCQALRTDAEGNITC